MGHDTMVTCSLCIRNISPACPITPAVPGQRPGALAPDRQERMSIRLRAGIQALGACSRTPAETRNMEYRVRRTMDKLEPFDSEAKYVVLTYTKRKAREAQRGHHKQIASYLPYQLALLAHAVMLPLQPSARYRYCRSGAVEVAIRRTGTLQSGGTLQRGRTRDKGQTPSRAQQQRLTCFKRVCPVRELNLTCASDYPQLSVSQSLYRLLLVVSSRLGSPLARC